MRRAMVVFALAGCDHLFGLDRFAPPVDAPPPYEKVITLTQDTGTTLTEFPVSITLAADPDLAAHAAADGGDLGFYRDSALLPAEIVSYAGGSLDAWVRIPSLPAGSSSIELRYGGARIPRDVSPWPATAVGVWHASDAGTAMVDQSGHHHDVDVTAGSTSPAVGAGIAGGARSFNGATDRLCGADSDHSMMFDKASFSFEVWVNVVENLTGMDRPFTYGGSTSADTGFDFELGAGFWVPNLSDGTTLLNVTAVDAMPGQWVHLVGVVNREVGQLELFEHGILRGMTPIPATFGGVDIARPICFSGAVAKFDGLLDEPRVYAEALDAAWIRASYANLAERAGFVAVGPELRIP